MSRVACSVAAMATRHRTFSFTSIDIDGIADEMRSFAEGADGKRWLNVVPDADDTEIHTGSIFWRMFSSRGPVIPQLTWVPAHPGKNGVEPAQVGLAHATGRQALDRLAGRGISVPSGFRPIQDHQKRGVIFVLDPNVPAPSIVQFGMGALRELSPFEFEDAFLATFSEQ